MLNASCWCEYRQTIVLSTRSYKSSPERKTDGRSKQVADAPHVILAFLHRIANPLAKKDPKIFW
jgi:hypothetical protein